MNKYALLAGLCLFVVAAGLVLHFPSGEKHRKTPVVKIGYFKGVLNDVPLFVAEKKGWFEEAGIEYELVPLTTSKQAVDAAATGRVDFYTLAATLQILAVQAVSPGKVKLFNVTFMTKERPFDRILVRKQSEINTLQDLAGKTLGVYPGSTMKKFIRRFLEKQDIDPARVNIIPVAAHNQVSALMSGSIDALHAYEPAISVLLESGEAEELYGSMYAQILSPAPIGGGGMAASFIRNHPVLADQIINILQRGYDFMKSHEKETTEIVVERTGLDPDVAARALFTYATLGPALTPDKIKAVQAYADMLHEMDELPAKIDVRNMIYQGGKLGTR